jgi:hypothetical protein
MITKLFHLTIIVISLLIFTTGIVSADSFSSTVDFYDSHHSYLDITDSYTYGFTLTGLNSTDFTLDNATLSLAHLENSNSDAELWFSYSNGDILIGQLSTSTGSGNTFMVDSWALSQAVLNEMQSTDPWSLTVKLLEDTGGTDKIKIDYSTLSGNYSPLSDDPPPGPSQNSVPEPSTLLLVSAGLAGLGLLREIVPKK